LHKYNISDASRLLSQQLHFSQFSTLPQQLISFVSNVTLFKRSLLYQNFVISILVFRNFLTSTCMLRFP